MTGEVIVFSTCPDEAVARRIAEMLVREQLAACVNRVTGVRSTYVWEGKLQDDSEVLLVIKTLDRHLPAIEARLGTVHPYEVPELVAIPISHGSERYLTWMRAAVTAP